MINLTDSTTFHPKTNSINIINKNGFEDFQTNLLRIRKRLSTLDIDIKEFKENEFKDLNKICVKRRMQLSEKNNSRFSIEIKKINDIVLNAEKTSKRFHSAFDQDKVHTMPYLTTSFHHINYDLCALKRAKKAVKKYLTNAPILANARNKANSFQILLNTVETEFNNFKKELDKIRENSANVIASKNEKIFRANEIEKDIKNIKQCLSNLKKAENNKYGNLDFINELSNTLDEKKLSLNKLRTEIKSYFLTLHMQGYIG